MLLQLAAIAAGPRLVEVAGVARGLLRVIGRLLVRRALVTPAVLRAVLARVAVGREAPVGVGTRLAVRGRAAGVRSGRGAAAACTCELAHANQRRQYQ